MQQLVYLPMKQNIHKGQTTDKSFIHLLVVYTAVPRLSSPVILGRSPGMRLYSSRASLNPRPMPSFLYFTLAWDWDYSRGYITCSVTCRNTSHSCIERALLGGLLWMSVGCLPSFDSHERAVKMDVPTATNTLSPSSSPEAPLHCGSSSGVWKQNILEGSVRCQLNQVSEWNHPFFSLNCVKIQLINPNFDVYNMAESIYPRPSVFEDRILVDTRLRIFVHRLSFDLPSGERFLDSRVTIGIVGTVSSLATLSPPAENDLFRSRDTRQWPRTSPLRAKVANVNSISCYFITTIE